MIMQSKHFITSDYSKFASDILDAKIKSEQLRNLIYLDIQITPIQIKKDRNISKKTMLKARYNRKATNI